MPTWNHDDTTLYYETFGFDTVPTAPVIVCLNGMTQTTQSWKSLARPWSARARVLLYDARGQGQSDLGPDLPLTLKQHALDLALLLEHLELERAHLVGFSHGARVALGLGAWHPERVDKLVVCSATGAPTALAQVIVESWGQILRLGGLEAMSWSALPSILGNDFFEQNASLLPGIVRASVQRNSSQGVAALLEGMAQYPDLVELARATKAPACVIFGQDDPLVEEDGATVLAKALGEAFVHRIDHVGHTVPIEAPEAFGQVVLSFLLDDE